MKHVNCLIKKNILVVLTLFSFVFSTSSQDREYLKDGSIEEQFNHVIEKSSAWESYKVISNNWVITLKKNILDSLNTYKKEIDIQKKSFSEKEFELLNLQENLTETKEMLNKIETEKDTIVFLGIILSKNIFITTITIIFTVLIVLIIIIFGLYNRSYKVIRKTQEEFETVSKEFENYRQESRKKYEQLVVQHHKEVQKFKGL